MDYDSTNSPAFNQAANPPAVYAQAAPRQQVRTDTLVVQRPQTMEHPVDSITNFGRRAGRYWEERAKPDLTSFARSNPGGTAAVGGLFAALLGFTFLKSAFGDKMSGGTAMGKIGTVLLFGALAAGIGIQAFKGIGNSMGIETRPMQTGRTPPTFADNAATVTEDRRNAAVEAAAPSAAPAQVPAAPVLRP